MKKLLVQISLGLVTGMISLSAFAIDDSVIFESIDSQKSLYGKIQQTNNSKVPVFHEPQHTEIIVEERSIAYASPTKSEATTFEKELVSKRVSKKMNAKKVEKLAQEIRETEF